MVDESLLVKSDAARCAAEGISNKPRRDLNLKEEKSDEDGKGLEKDERHVKRFKRIKFDDELYTRIGCLIESFTLANPPNRLGRVFYEDEDTLSISRRFLNCLLWTSSKEGVTVGRITETEAYVGEVDTASHAAGGRRTKRNSAMYEKGGTSYVYLCYGIHKMLNITTSKKDIPKVILVRAIAPIAGFELMIKRRSLVKEELYNPKLISSLGRGPGCVGQCMDISLKDNMLDLVDSQRMWITEPLDINSVTEYVNAKLNQEEQKAFSAWQLTSQFQIAASPRIGIESASLEARLKEYRFYIQEDSSVSKVHINKKKLKI